MAQYITGERVRLAVDRLRQSRAATGMINFLILKRALALNPPDGFVRLSTKDTHLQQAIDELSWWPATKDDKADRPFANVFGTLSAKNNGTMSKKYRSNGPSDTFRKRTWEKVVETKQADESLAAKLTENYREELSRLTLVRDKDRPLPRLNDAAVWFFRGKDIEKLIGTERSPAAIEKILVMEFCKQANLDKEDCKLLFAPETGNAN
jgi:hypothetical protein